ncbi:MAG: hypothetical protein HZR80_09750 [Candidatus Heimdallarchaeota archaeon]
MSIRPVITTDPFDNVHIVWQDMTDLGRIGTDDDIFYKVWNATTHAWSIITVLSPSGMEPSVGPEITADGLGNVHVIWRDKTDILGAGSDTDIFYRHWNKTTDSWSSIELVSNQSTGNVYWSSLDAKEGIVYVAWQDTTNYLGNGADEDVLVSKRDISGIWIPAETISTEGSTISSFPDIKIDDYHNIHVCWDDATYFDNSGIDRDIFYRFKNGTTDIWSPIEVISSSSDLASDRPVIIISSNGDRFISWMDSSNILGAGIDSDIFYRKWDATSRDWSNVELLSSKSSGESNIPYLVLDSFENIHAFWFDTNDFDNAGIDQDIFYRYWNSSADVWSEYTVISDDQTNDSWRSEVDIDSQNIIHVVWHDRTINYGGSGSDVDILYSKGPIPKAAPYLTITDRPLDEVFISGSIGNYLS